MNVLPKADQAVLRTVAAQTGKPLPEAHSQAHPVPEVFRHVIEVDWFREFTLRERLGILFGANLRVFIRIPTRHNPAALQPVIAAELSKYPDAESEIKAQLQNVLVNKDQPHDNHQPQNPSPPPVRRS